MKALSLAILTLSGLGVIFGILLAWASKRFPVEVDPRIKKIVELLPGANCGACGMTGCSIFAEAMLQKRINLSYCVACTEENKKEIISILATSGQKIEERDDLVAVINCGGGNRSQDKFKYNGLADCHSAEQTLRGFKECSFACHEQGTCIITCPFGAIKMQPWGVPKVLVDLCRGCQKCIAVCPRNLICMIRRGKSVYINCQSHAKGQEVIKSCKVGCISCAKCVKICPVSAINIEHNLAKIDYNKCTDCRKCVDVCPTKTISIL
ncbi:MAG: RnfABCDGE type electron transport complex subunit B [Gammaproteobacteria bacterium]|nr:RnfABCDGE type electron transport complex subunit B [Gammaproteobacteria bacterium]